MKRRLTWSVVLAVSLLRLAGCGGKADPGETAVPPGGEPVAETTNASGPDGWFTPAEAHTPWCPPNPDTELVSVDELLVPCDGGKRAENVVAFTADVNRWVNGPRLALASIDGKSWAYLGVEGEYPQFSPDGTKIAYREIIPDDKTALYVINADGSGKKILSGDDCHLTGFAFTPDSRAVVYTAFQWESPNVMVLADVAGRGRRVIYSSEERLGSPSLPASGEEIAFERGRDIYAINVDGTGLRRVTGPSDENEEIGDLNPAFSPDGSKIAFISGDATYEDHGMSLDAYIVNADGTGRRNVTTNDTREEKSDFSPDSEVIVFQSWEGGITIVDVNRYELRRVPTTGGAGSYHDHLTPRFSPDGGKIVYDPAYGENMSTRQIYIINADGTGDTWVSPGGKVCYEHPCFSPTRVDGVLLDTYGRVIEE